MADSTRTLVLQEAAYKPVYYIPRADAIWSYETPFPAMKEIEGHLAFYPNRFDKIEAGPA